jgi:hypothetical protein
MEQIQRGTFKILRTDGTEELIREKPTLARIYKEIHADIVDTVLLDRDSTLLMVVDDTGMIDNKLINPQATALYLSVYKPGTDWAICGDVALVYDQDFA